MSESASPSAPAGSQVLFNGPTFHVTGVQIVRDAEEVSVYLTTTRHAFNASATQVRTVNEIVARMILSPATALRIAEAIRNTTEPKQ